jgi:uncharacterized protein
MQNLYFPRFLDLKEEAKKKSIFLFGPRQTGKTSLLKRLFPQSPFYNLLFFDQFFKFSRRPNSLREELIEQKDSLQQPIIIDEIQKLPVLLDEVHAMIEEYGFTFILTGSNSRKLRRGGFNLLGGRARFRFLHPFVYPELPDFDLIKTVNFGALPPIHFSDDPDSDLLSYCGLYLQEEIQNEGAARKIEVFSRFLQTAALMNTQLVNFESVASDAGIPVRTVREYFQVLEDTHIGILLKPYKKAIHRKAVGAAKFYFFDVGVANSLAGRKGIRPGTELFGNAFEHFIFTELIAWRDYTKDSRPLTFFRDRTAAEVDFVIGDDIAIEIKGTELVTEKHIKGLRLFSDSSKAKRFLIVSLDTEKRKLGHIEIFPYKQFLDALWSGKLS